MIAMENHTPFPLMAFEKYGTHGLIFDVIAFRMTLRLKNGHYADLASEQGGLVMADEYYGDPERTSLKYETDLVLYKRNTDIHIIGNASLAGGKQTQWMAGVRVGDFSKRLNLSGPRFWQYEKRRWQLSPAEAIESVPLRYELAYGGHWQPEGQQNSVFSANPVGCGYYPDERRLDTTQQYRAPQITRYLTHEEDEPDITAACTPQGTGPVSRWWQSRLQHAGTYDEAWKTNTHPFLPNDFDELFYNSAHPELIHPGYLSGNEVIVLEGLLPEANRVVTGLPDLRPVCVLTDSHSIPHLFEPVPDTLTINLDERLMYITWRLTLPTMLEMKEGVMGCIVPPGIGRVCHG